MALLMFILSLAIAFAQEQFVGVWLVVLAIWADFYARYFPV